MSDPRAKANVVTADVPRNAWSVREFAATLGVNVHTIYRLIKHGQLAWFPVGGEKRIPNSELDRLLAEAYERRVSA